jgi:hypothetical protein
MQLKFQNRERSIRFASVNSNLHFEYIDSIEHFSQVKNLLVKVERIHSFNYGGNTAEKYLFFDVKAILLQLILKTQN